MNDTALAIPEASALLARWSGLGARVTEADAARLSAVLQSLPAHDPRAVAGALDVAAQLAALRLDGDTLLAALLAGIPRAAPAGRELSERFGPAVAALVDGVGRMERIRALRAGLEVDRGGDRAAQLEALRKMLLAMVQDVRVVLVKLAAEVVRLRELARAGGEAQRREAARETFELTAPLANRLGVWQLKWELEDLAFRCEDPDTYRAIARGLDGKRADREAFIARVTAQLRDALARAGVHAELAGRPKHIYSIWKKMQRKDLGSKDLFDVRAVRVLVEDMKDCYTALGVVHLFTPIPREFDDYIAKPKPNGYRSLHTAVVGPTRRCWRCRSAPARCTRPTNSALPPTGATRRAAGAIRARMTRSRGCGRSSTGARTWTKATWQTACAPSCSRRPSTCSRPRGAWWRCRAAPRPWTSPITCTPTSATAAGAPG
jgi:GTP pyrophosphokinase